MAEPPKNAGDAAGQEATSANMDWSFAGLASEKLQPTWGSRNTAEVENA